MNISSIDSQANSYETDMWDAPSSYSDEQSTSSSNKDIVLQKQEDKDVQMADNPCTKTITDQKVIEFIREVFEEEEKKGCIYASQKIYEKLKDKGYKGAGRTARLKIHSLREKAGLQVIVKKKDPQVQLLAKEYIEMKQQGKKVTVRKFFLELKANERYLKSLSLLNTAIRETTQNQEGRIDVQIAENPYATSQALGSSEHIDEHREMKLPKETRVMTQKMLAHIRSQVEQEKTTGDRCEPQKIYDQLIMDYGYQGTKNAVINRIQFFRRENGLSQTRSVIMTQEMLECIRSQVEQEKTTGNRCKPQKMYDQLIMDYGYKGIKKTVEKKLHYFRQENDLLPKSMKIINPQQQEDETDVQKEDETDVRMAGDFESKNLLSLREENGPPPKSMKIINPQQQEDETDVQKEDETDVRMAGDFASELLPLYEEEFDRFKKVIEQVVTVR